MFVVHGAETALGITILAGLWVRGLAVLQVGLLSAFTALEKGGPIEPHCIEINRLENEGDRIGRSAVVELLNK